MEKLIIFIKNNKILSVLIAFLTGPILAGVIFTFNASTFIDGFVFFLLLETFVLLLACAITSMIVGLNKKTNDSDNDR